MTRGLTVLLICCASAYGGDWPQFLGSHRNGDSSETNLALTWPKEGPPVIWKAKAGQGWSGPIVISNRVVLFHRIANEETVQSFDAMSGAPIWKAGYPSDYSDDFGFDEGPRATPASDGEMIVTFGANGLLNAWSARAGSHLWEVDIRKQYQAAKGFFGIACSPLIDGPRVILNIGGRNGAGVAAFDKKEGKLLWKATSEEASYSSPTIATIGSKRRLFVLTRRALFALDPESGNALWRHPFEPSISASVTAATPLVIGDKVFISASYGAGAELLRFRENAPDVIWSKDDVLSSHYATSVQRDGMLFGFDGRQEQRCHLRCVELETGKVRWSEEHFGAGQILATGNALLILTERGELITAKASADKFKPMSRAQMMGLDCRAAPALANGFFYARDKSNLYCVDLRQR